MVRERRRHTVGREGDKYKTHGMRIVLGGFLFPPKKCEKVVKGKNQNLYSCSFIPEIPYVRKLAFTERRSKIQLKFLSIVERGDRRNFRC